MIKVNIKSGETLSFDLNSEIGLNEWIKCHNDIKFQNSITGIGIIYSSQWYTLPLPKKFMTSIFYAEIVKNRKNNNESVGERVICHSDEIRVSLLVYYGKRPRMCRIDVKKIGKCRFNPIVKKGG